MLRVRLLVQHIQQLNILHLAEVGRWSSCKLMNTFFCPASHAKAPTSAVQQQHTTSPPMCWRAPGGSKRVPGDGKGMGTRDASASRVLGAVSSFLLFFILLIVLLLDYL
jgi:hypothetical protein